MSFNQIYEYSRAGLLDGMEVISEKPRKHDAQRLRLAHDLGIAAIGSSDAHKAPDVGNVATRIPGKLGSVKEVIYQIKRRNCEPFVPKVPGYLQEITERAGLIYERDRLAA